MGLSFSKKAMVVVNPCAGRRKLSPQLLDIADLLSKGGIETTIYTTSASGDATEFVKNFSHKFDIVVCRGGDGTFNEVVNGMMVLEKKLPIGYIPSGTTNDLASSLNIPKNTKKAIDVVINGKPVGNDVGHFNDDSYFSYSASFGAFTQSSYATPQRLKNSFGHLAYVYVGIKSIGQIGPIRVKVKCEHFEDDWDEYIFGTVANSLSLGKIVKFDKKIVDLSDGKFEVMLVKKPDNAQALKGILTSVAKKDYDERYVKFFQSSEIEFEFEEDIPWTIDGEFGGAGKLVKIQNLQNAINILR